jgi:hypothetical protein
MTTESNTKAPKKAKPAAKKNQETKVIDDPGMAKYHGMMMQGEDGEVLKKSLLTSLGFFLLMLFIVFPEFASQIINAQVGEDNVEMPKQTIVKQEQKQEKKQEVKRETQQKKNDFAAIPDISRPSGEFEIVEDLDRDKLDVNMDDLDMMGFGDMPTAPPGPVEVAGNVLAPAFMTNIQLPFPPRAKMLRKSGVVVARLIVKKDGSFEVVEIQQETPPGFGFKEAYLQYLNSGTFKPATQNGRPIDVYYKFGINFTLN